MTMDSKEFKHNVLIHGADIHQWPKEIREKGLKALASSAELKKMLAEHEEFEHLLRNRNYEEPSGTLTQRIISASLRKHGSAPLRLNDAFSDLFAGFSMRRWAVTAISVLIIGFILGFTNPFGSSLADETQTGLQTFLYYEGEIL